MTPIDRYPTLPSALVMATAKPTERLYYVRDIAVSKPKNQTEKRFKAFSQLVLTWIKGNIEIGNGTLQAICLVTHFHEELVTSQNQQELEPKLNEAMDYFENIMGNTFSLL